MSTRRAARTAPAPPAPRARVRRDVDITRVLIAIVVVLGVVLLAYLGVVLTLARQGLDVRHLVDVSLGPKQYGTLAGFGAGLVGFMAVLKRSNKTEKMVGYDVPHGVAEAMRAELTAHAQAAAAERDRHHAAVMEQARQHHGLLITRLDTIAAALSDVGQDGLDHTNALDDLVDLLQDAQVQVSFGNPDRLKPLHGDQPPAPVLKPEPEPEPLEPVGERGPQLVPADRVWGPAGPPRLRPGGRSSHRANTGTLPPVPAEVLLPAPADVPRVERHAETLPPLPPLPSARTSSPRPYDLARLSAKPSTAVQRAVDAIEAGESFDDVIVGRSRQGYRPAR